MSVRVIRLRRTYREQFSTNKSIDGPSEFLCSFQGGENSIGLALRKRCLSPPAADEFVFGDFPDVENNKNSDSLDFLVLLCQDKRTIIKAMKESSIKN